MAFPSDPATTFPYGVNPGQPLAAGPMTYGTQPMQPLPPGPPMQPMRRATDQPTAATAYQTPQYESGLGLVLGGHAHAEQEKHQPQ